MDSQLCREVGLKAKSLSAAKSQKVMTLTATKQYGPIENSSSWRQPFTVRAPLPPVQAKQLRPRRMRCKQGLFATCRDRTQGRALFSTTSCFRRGFDSTAKTVCEGEPAKSVHTTISVTVEEMVVMLFFVEERQ